MFKRPDPIKAQAQLREWFRERLEGEHLAVTLTFHPPPGEKLDESQAQATLRHFLRRLANRVYGSAAKRFGRKLQVVPVLEGGTGPNDKHLHYHLQIEIPLGFEPDRFGRLCIEVWRELDWASQTQNVYRYCTNGEGWTNYILKPRDKADYLSAIDFSNMALN